MLQSDFTFPLSAYLCYNQDQMEDSENLSRVNDRGSEAERYQKVRVLGEGSMGKAYLVRSAQDEQQYVMKRINIGHLQPKEKEAALRQAQLHSLLQHPNIVQFKELYQTTGDKLCIIMEYAEGGDLQEFIRNQNGKLLPQSTVLSIFAQICLGLQEVHAKKIIHRDLKTANIFLGKDKQVKIGDFGISRTLDKTQLAATSMIGTPYYLSPEMVEGKPYSTKADVWALGVVLYQLCSYKLPFEANSLPVLALKILKGAFPPIPNQYSKDLKALLLQMLCTDQKRRPSVEMILTKPFISKYLPQEQKVKLIAKQEQRQEAKKEREKKLQKVEKADKGDEKDLKEKAKRQKEEKREELRKQMREDLKKKRAQKEYESANLSVPEQPKELKKSPKKDISITPKLQPNTKVKKEEIAKPWKTKKINEKKDITIEIFAPEPKPQQFVEPLKVQEVKHKQAKPQSSKQIEEGRKSMPLITQKKDNYHYSEKNRYAGEAEDDEEGYLQEQIEEEDDDDDFNELMNNVRNVEELTKNLPKPSREVCLFEDSGNFESTISPAQQQQPQPHQLESLKQVLSAESLEELRFILEENLGDNRFREAYSVIKEHLDNYYELLHEHQEDRERLKKQYMFNQEILKDKLHFLTADQLQRNLELLFTLIIYEEIETHRNTDSSISKYERLL